MTDNFKEIGSLFGREGAGAGFAKQTDKESFTYAFAWPEGDTWATLTGYLNLDEQPEEYVRRVLQDGGFRSDWDNPDYDPIGDFKETAGDEYRIPLLKVLLREQLASRYEVANHFSTMNRARVELSAFIQNEGGAPLPEDALGTPEEQGIRAMLIATCEPPREVTLLPDKNGSTLKPLQALVGGNIETFDIAFGEGVSLYVNDEGLFTCPPNRAIFATEEMAKAGYLSQLDYSKVVEMGDFCFPGGSRQQPDQGGCSACHPSRDRCLRHPAHRGHQAGRHGKLRGARSGDEYGFERLQQAELHPLLRPVTGYGCLRVRKRQENRCARRPIRASACGKLLRSRY